MALPTTMKVVHQPDPHSTSLVLEESPLPTPTPPHNYLIRVLAASPCLNELNWEAWFPDFFPENRERVPCTECSGVVVAGVASGADEPAFGPGDEVFFRASPSSTGSLREYTVAQGAWMARKPARLGWAEAAATPLSSLTAYQGLFEHGGVDRAALRGDEGARERNSGLRVLVAGAGGGVGSWAVQLAVAAGVGSVVAVCGPSKVVDVAKLGPAGQLEVVDYSVQSLESWASGREADCDLVLDCAGGATLAACWAAVREGGRLFSVVAGPDEARPEAYVGKKLARSEFFLVRPDGTDLADVARLVDEGRCFPWVDSVFEFADFEKAFKKVEGKGCKGKVVIKVATQ